MVTSLSIGRVVDPHRSQLPFALIFLDLVKARVLSLCALGFLVLVGGRTDPQLLPSGVLGELITEGLSPAKFGVEVARVYLPGGAIDHSLTNM